MRTDENNRARSLLALRLVIYALLFYGALVVLQDRQLYFPSNLPLQAVLDDAQRDGLVPWPSATDYRGLLREPSVRHGPFRGTLLLFHGNAGHAGHRSGYADIFSSFGLRVILAEYPAYGPRTGKLGEASLVSDATETIARVRRDFAGPLLLAGESLGAGVAAAALARSPADISALLLITPWDKLEHAARFHFPWLPVGWLLHDKYNSQANLADYHGTVAVIVAAGDTIVPAQLGKSLFDSLSAPKRLWVIPAADHNDWITHVDAVWWQSIVHFLLDSPIVAAENANP